MHTCMHDRYMHRPTDRACMHRPTVHVCMYASYACSMHRNGGPPVHGIKHTCGVLSTPLCDTSCIAYASVRCAAHYALVHVVTPLRMCMVEHHSMHASMHTCMHDRYMHRPTVHACMHRPSVHAYMYP